MPLEPHCAVAQYDLDGKVTGVSEFQSPYAVRQALSTAFDIPLNKLRVISPYVRALRRQGGHHPRRHRHPAGSSVNRGPPGQKLTYTR